MLDGASTDVDDVVATLREAQRGLTAFDPVVVEFANDLSRRLRRHGDVRRFPAMGALAWWIRPATIEGLRAHWSHLCDVRDVVRAPRGLVFHLPPTNVDTLFVYSWLLSALTGNANAIRISPRAADAGGPLLDTVITTLADHPVVGSTTALVSYGHDTSVTAAFSASDMRVIWGGDETVAAVRAVPMAPHAIELAFPDRFSFAVFDAHAVSSLSGAELGDLVHRFVNDAYWFDQLGCASPRLVVWRGSAADTANAAHHFHDALRSQVRERAEDIATSAVVAKLVHAASSAADGVVGRIDWSANEVTVATLGDVGGVAGVRRDNPGGGLFYEARIDALEQLVEHLERRDQTMTHFGFGIDELRTFASSVGARGIDRIVPVGQALTFANIWDGHDLLAAFSRSVQVSG